MIGAEEVSGTEYFYEPMLHEVFEQPTRPEVSIWRYLDVAKLVSLLATRSLHFARMDQLGDPFEGSLPIQVSRELGELYALPEDYPEGVEPRLLREYTRLRTAANCWHVGDHESAAMWRLYLSGSQGVCVRSTFARLRDAFAQRRAGKSRNSSTSGKTSGSIFIGLVKYIDYGSFTSPVFRRNMFAPLMHKRKSFEHERELRALALPGGRGSLREPGIPVGGIDIPVNLETLVEAVYVAPNSPAWFADVVRSIARAYAAKFEIRQSALEAAPLF